MQKAVDHLTISKQTDLAEVEERKNKQLDDLVKAHDKAFLDLKNYYNDITLNNLALISSLKVSIYFFPFLFISRLIIHFLEVPNGRNTSS